MSADELLGAPDESAVPSFVTETLRGNTVPERGQSLLRCSDDAFRPIEYSCIPFPMEQGMGAIFGFRELTHEAELEKDLRRLAAIADESPIPIVELNQDANLMYANPAMMALIERFGFSTEARPLILPANILKLTRSCLETRAGTGAVEVSVAGNHYEWKLFPVSSANLVRGYGMDATARKRALIDLTLAKARTEVASQAKSKILSNVTQEIHDPLERIEREADLLLDGALSQEQLEAVNSIKTSCKALMTSVKEILSIAALRNDNPASQAGSFNFRTFVARVLAPFVRRAAERGLQLTVTISNRVPCDVTCDGLQLEQLFRTVLRKVIEATNAGEISIEVDRDAIALPQSPDLTNESFRLFISIAYSGSGFFSPAATNTSDNEVTDAFPESPMEETALALRCTQLATLLGGTVAIEKDLGGGGRFCFSLPVRQAKSEPVRFTTGNGSVAAT